MSFAVKNNVYIYNSKTIFKNKVSSNYMATSIIEHFKLKHRTNRLTL